MKKICITIDAPTERRIDKLSEIWNTNKSETIRICVDEVFIDKCYNGYGIVAVHKKKGGKEKRNAQHQELELKRSRFTKTKKAENPTKSNG